MKALAGVLLAFALAAGIGNQVDAKQCITGKHTTKHVTKSSIKHHGTLASRSSKKSKLTTCVCRVGTSKTKHISSTGMIKSSSYGGYKKPVNSTLLNPMESTDTMFNGNRSLNNNNQNMDMNNGNRNLNNDNKNIDRNFNNGTQRTDSLINPNGNFDNNMDNRTIDSLNNGSSGEYMDHGK